jgi:hypothetical protein
MVFPVEAFADVEDTAVITASADKTGSDVHIYQILGTWAGTITFEIKSRGAPDVAASWASVDATNLTDSAVAVSTTANGIFRLLLNDGLDSRARFSTDTSGAPQVWRTQRSI